MNIHTIATHLNQLQDATETGFDFDCTPLMVTLMYYKLKLLVVKRSLFFFP